MLIVVEQMLLPQKNLCFTKSTPIAENVLFERDNGDIQFCSGSKSGSNNLSVVLTQKVLDCAYVILDFLGKADALSHQSSAACAKGEIESFDVIGKSSLFSVRAVLLFWNCAVVGRAIVGIEFSVLSVDIWDIVPHCCSIL